MISFFGVLRLLPVSSARLASFTLLVAQRIFNSPELDGFTSPYLSQCRIKENPGINIARKLFPDREWRTRGHTRRTRDTLSRIKYWPGNKYYVRKSRRSFRKMKIHLQACNLLHIKRLIWKMNDGMRRYSSVYGTDCSHLDRYFYVDRDVGSRQRNGCRTWHNETHLMVELIDSSENVNGYLFPRCGFDWSGLCLCLWLKTKMAADLV